MRVAIAGALVGLALLAAPVVSAADLTVRVDAREVARKRVHTELELAVAPGPLTLVFPKWIPGEHGPSGPLNTLVGLTIRADGAPLPWQRDPRDMFALRVTVPAGVRRLQIALDSGLPLEGGEFTAGPTSSAQLAVLSWNEYVLLPKGRDASRLSVAASVLAPPKWQLACALQLQPQADGSVQLEPTNLAQLIDSPVQLGQFTRVLAVPGSAPLAQLPHSLALAADSAAALEVPEDFAAGYGRLVQQAGALFGTRMYRHYTWLLTLSDHVAHFGLEHHESSDDRVDENALSDAPLREDLAELLAHEYVHSWNGKYRRPAGLLSPDYQQPMDGSLLWVYEGMTQFWGTVLPVRAGLMPPDSYHEMLASVASSFELESGNRWRPLADTAVAAQLLSEAPAAWSSSRRDLDYYEASEFLWLNVDSELRRRSGGQVTLDDFVRRFYAGPGGAGALKPYVEQDIYAGLNALVAADWRALIHRHLDSLGPEVLLEALRGSGWQLSYSAQKNSYLETQQRRRKDTDRQASLGLRLDEKAVVVETIEGGAAARAGIGPGMQLVAVNGRKFSAEALDAALVAAQASRQPLELLLESGDYYRSVSVPYFDGPRWPHLTRIETQPDLLTPVVTSRSAAN
jgi:predicted metalloprotease with PDZ domain